MDQVVEDAGMIGLLRQDAVQNLRGALLVPVLLVIRGRRRN